MISECFTITAHNNDSLFFDKHTQVLHKSYLGKLTKCKRNGKLTIYIFETTKKVQNWPELL